MIISTFKVEENLVKKGYESIVGIDEAGRGPLAGPVVAGAVIFKHNFDKKFEDEKILDLVRDSKTLSEKQREKAFDFIQENFYIGVGICDHETIDRMNILEASFLAMKKAISLLNKNVEEKHRKSRRAILLDGNKKIPNLSLSQKAIPRGDLYIKSISAASIVAKVTRDRLMIEAHDFYPEYQFDRHKGYGTKLHFEMLKEYGPCKIHRQSFSPVREALSLAKSKK